MFSYLDGLPFQVPPDDNPLIAVNVMDFEAVEGMPHHLMSLVSVHIIHS